MRTHTLAAALVAVLASTNAAAQGQTAWRNDVFAGYSALVSGAAECPDCGDTGGDSEILHGWHAALGWGLSGRLGLVLDASGHQGQSSGGDDVSILSLMAGPRLAFGSGRVRPFVHVIGGVVRSKAGIGIFEVEISRSTTGFGGAAGGGLDLGFGERWALRVAGDYRMARLEGETAGDPRISAGVVYRFGTK